MTQGERLAAFAEQVRESTLKRFRQVQAADRGWRPGPERLSFVDHLEHLVDADGWIMAVIQGQPEPNADVKPGDGDPAKWDEYFRALEESGKRKAEYFRGLSDDQLNRIIDSPAHLEKPEAAMLILRENIEHEIQHRGSIQLMLRLKYG
jgi:uncharacterized damage-inducible protein DinB